MPNWRYEQTFQGDASVRIDAMDLHVKTNRIFWTNWHTGRISSYELLGQSTSSTSSNSHRNRRQSEGRVTNLQVMLVKYVWKDDLFITLLPTHEHYVNASVLVSRSKS